MNVTIIGGGVIGLCTAYYLHKAGHMVTVIERGDITDGCSFGNMGYVSPSHFVPLASPGIVAKGLKWMLSSSSPFYIKPRLNMDLIRWGLAFWRRSNARTAEKNAVSLNGLLRLSRELMSDFREEFGKSIELTEIGCFMLYKNEKTGKHEKHLADEARKFGLKTEICTREKVQQYEPEVEVDVAGGVLYLDDCHLHSGKFMMELFRFLREQGVQFYINTRVTGFERSNGNITSVITDKLAVRCENLVVANGSWMPEVARLMEIDLLMQPGKGYSLAYDGLERNLHYPSILVDDRTATTPIGRWLRIGGTMELSGHSDNILPRRVMAIYNAFKKYYPGMDLPQPQPRKAWYGYRPVTPDGLPYIGKHRNYENTVFAGGHAMLGVSSAAATGKLVTEILNKKKTSIDISGFGVERFARG